MTNREKFWDVFGIELPLYEGTPFCANAQTTLVTMADCIEQCIKDGRMPCDDCPWWNYEYKESN